MARILENNGIDNTNIDGASFNNFCAGQRSGIIKGRLNECAITSPSSSVVNVNTGELLIYGVRVVIDSTNFTFSTFPSTATRYSLVAEIVIDDESVITHRIFVQLASVALTKNDLYATATGAGTYQIELAKFTLSTSGVSDLIRTVDIITGGTGGGSGTIEIGAVTTETLDPEIPAEVDVDYNEETGKVDFSFSIPKGDTGAGTYTTITFSILDWTDNFSTKTVIHNDGAVLQLLLPTLSTTALTLANNEAFSDANIIIDSTDYSAGTVTFYCETVPTIDITIVMEVK